MSTVQEIQHVGANSQATIWQHFASGLPEFDGVLWDTQLEADIAAGRLDKLGDVALRDLQEGRCSELWDIQRLHVFRIQRAHLKR